MKLVNEGELEQRSHIVRGLYILNESREPVPCDDINVWGRWMESADRRVALTDISEYVKVSTVFLGLDHGYGGTPLLFETMVFGGEHDEACQRSTSWAEAEQAHQSMVELVRRGDP